VSAFWTGFWTWATAHEILAFILLYFVLKTIRVMFKSVFRIWWTPTPRLAAPPPDDDANEEDGIRLSIVHPPTPPALPRGPRRLRQPEPAAPARPRRSMWDRVLGDDSD
jgi:hypothetical protein